MAVLARGREHDSSAVKHAGPIGLGALLILAACSSSPSTPAIHAQLHPASKYAAGASLPGIAVNKPYVVYVGSLCVTGPGSVTPIKIDTVRPTGSMTITGWAAQVHQKNGSSNDEGI